MLHNTRYLPILLFIILVFSGCSNNPTSQEGQEPYNYGTTNDSARHYFMLGWSEIMDNGRWTESEAAFRKAIEFDPDWQLGKSLVGRITQDTEERKAILADLEAHFAEADPDEKMLLAVNMQSLQASNNRDEGIPNAAGASQKRRQMAEENFGAFAKKYPNDDYFKAEYIEFVHLNHGAQTALDTLMAWATPEQKELGFYLGFSGSLALELDQMEKAEDYLALLQNAVPDKSCPSPLVLEAQIWFTKDSLERAKTLIDQVVQMDSNHLIAKGMQAQLASQLPQ